MKLGLRVFLGYFFALGLSAWLSLNWIERELRPLVRQVSEEALVETAYALAASVQPAMIESGVPDAAQMQSLMALSQTSLQANIWGIQKQRLNLEIYITDAKGIVIFDSQHKDVGKDFSQWNNVLRTLRGQYGARSTRTDPDNDATTVMHISAPIKSGEKMMGVLTVALPAHSTQVFLQQAKNNLHWYGFIILSGSLVVGILFTWWLIVSLRRISDYAEHAAERRTALPQFAKGTELEKLTLAIDSMRDEIEGHHYLENYVHHLTHELKSPLSAIRASNELLADNNMPVQQRIRFVANVEQQCERLQTLTDRLLELIRIEKKRQLDTLATVSLVSLVQQEVQALQSKAKQHGVEIAMHVAERCDVAGDPLLLALALRNLLENALQFADVESVITVDVVSEQGVVTINIRNKGSSIPDYALPRLGERFYSLPHPDGTKGTGLGLAFVKEIAELHHGAFSIANVECGVCSQLTLPAA